MRLIQATPRQAQVLDLLVEFGESSLIARKLGLSADTVQGYINKSLDENGHGNRVTLAVAWDRQKRANE